MDELTICNFYHVTLVTFLVAADAPRFFIEWLNFGDDHLVNIYGDVGASQRAVRVEPDVTEAIPFHHAFRDLADETLNLVQGRLASFFGELNAYVTFEWVVLSVCEAGM